MTTKLYVGNLPYQVTEDALTNYFAQAGQVSSAKIITDRDTGRSKGFGFVEMATEEEANTAIETLNGKEFEGRTLRVSPANPPRPRTGVPFQR
ncbi:MAG: RNA-binding protein [Bacteriovoracaceae bacterium]|nr:RNA-binding protein [Bacteriovoracaceae bacterium]